MAPLHDLAKSANEAPRERLQQPRDDKDDDDAPGADQREPGLVIQAVQVGEEVFN
jgi:hypothetical protein